MTILNMFQPGMVVYSIHNPRLKYTVIAMRNGMLKLSGYESNGFYFTASSFRKVN